VAWREDRVKFWAAIAGGAKTEDAAIERGCHPRLRSGGSATLVA
jgi:hypothetical protein